MIASGEMNILSGTLKTSFSSELTIDTSGTSRIEGVAPILRPMGQGAENYSLLEVLETPIYTYYAGGKPVGIAVT
jgi:hypothetical protein